MNPGCAVDVRDGFDPVDLAGRTVQIEPILVGFQLGEANLYMMELALGGGRKGRPSAALDVLDVLEQLVRIASPLSLPLVRVEVELAFLVGVRVSSGARAIPVARRARHLAVAVAVSVMLVQPEVWNGKLRRQLPWELSRRWGFCEKESRNRDEGFRGWKSGKMRDVESRGGNWRRWMDESKVGWIKFNGFITR